MRDITLNPEHRLCVIGTEAVVSCFACDDTRDHVRQIALRLHRPESALDAQGVGARAGRERFLATT